MMEGYGHVDHMAGVGSKLAISGEIELPTMVEARAEHNHEFPELVPPVVTTTDRGGDRNVQTTAEAAGGPPVAGTSTPTRPKVTPPVQPLANGGQRPQAVVSEDVVQPRQVHGRNDQPMRRSSSVVKPPQRLNL